MDKTTAGVLDKGGLPSRPGVLDGPLGSLAGGAGAKSIPGGRHRLPGPAAMTRWPHAD